MEDESAAMPDEERAHHYSVRELRKHDATPHAKRQWQKVLEIRDTLKAYST